MDNKINMNLILGKIFLFFGILIMILSLNIGIQTLRGLIVGLIGLVITFFGGFLLDKSRHYKPRQGLNNYTRIIINSLGLGVVSGAALSTVNKYSWVIFILISFGASSLYFLFIMLYLKFVKKRK